VSNEIHTPNQITAKVAYEVRKATLAERDRIIKLLEKHGVELVEDNWEDNQAVNDAYIALIKGESK
jgi:hypothetical protein